MAKISWKNEYSVGHSLLDLQHQQMIKIINTLIDHSNASADSETISDTLANMREYANRHFETEERLLRKYRYLEVEEQHKQHMYFIKRASELAVETINQDPAVARDILDFLGTWWVTHILKWDMKYKNFLLEKVPDLMVPFIRP